MKKFGLMLAALGAIVVAAPSIASAQTVVIKRGGGYHGHHHGHHHGCRATRVVKWCQQWIGE